MIPQEPFPWAASTIERTMYAAVVLPLVPVIPMMGRSWSGRPNATAEATAIARRRSLATRAGVSGATAESSAAWASSQR